MRVTVEKRITCDDGCGKSRLYADDLSGTEVVELVWHVPGGTERVQFIKISHAKKWIRDQQDATPDPPA
jgi:hypothetical protein